MNILTMITVAEIFVFVVLPLIIVAALCFLFAAWLDSRDTHIEPITFEPKRTHKFPKIDISVAYQGAKVGHVLGGRK